MQPKVCILSFSNIAWDARVLREIEAASKHYQVDVIGYGNWDSRGVARFFPVTRGGFNLSFRLSKIDLPLGKLNPASWEHYYWQLPQHQQALEIVLREKYDLIHANDWNSLPIAAQASRQTGSQVLYDAHEYTPAAGSETLLNKLWYIPYREYLLRNYQGEIKKSITVSDGLRNLYRTNFGWFPDVIMNAPYYRSSEFRPTDPGHIRLVHHGGASPLRHLEDLIHLTELLDQRYTFHFLLTPANAGYLRKLIKLAQRRHPQRIVFHDPVPPKELSRELAQFDIGIPWLRPSNLNHLNALPNKFFDFIIAGLSVVASPLPSMQMLIEQHGIGVVASGQGIRRMADTLNSLSIEKIDQYKHNSLKLATILNAEVEMDKLMHIYQTLLAS